MENHQAYCGGYKFSKVLIITWNTQFYHWQQMLSVAWSDGLTLFIFGKMSASYPGLNSHIVCLLATLSIKNGIPWEKKAKHFLNNHHTSEYRSTLYFLIISSIQLLSHVQPHGLQHSWLPCPSPTPRACSDSYVHQVGDAIQPSHPLSFHSPPALSLSQHQGLFQWVSSLYQVAKVLELQLQHLPMNIQDWSPCKGTLKSLLQQRSSNINSSVLSFLYSPTLTSVHWLLKKA